MSPDHKFYLNPNEVNRLAEYLRCEQRPNSIERDRWQALKYGLHPARPHILTSELKILVDTLSFEVVSVLRSA